MPLTLDREECDIVFVQVISSKEQRWAVLWNPFRVNSFQRSASEDVQAAVLEPGPDQINKQTSDP